MRATTTYRRRTEEEWDRIAGAYVESGLTQRAFCEGCGLALSSLQWALRRIREREQAHAASEEVDFVAVEIDSRARPPEIGPGDRVLYEVAFATGTRLKLYRGFDAGEVQQLMAILKE